MRPSHALPAVVLGLIAAAPAQRALLDELPADADAYTLRGIGFGREFTPVELPGTGEPRGIAHIGKVVWFARGDRLLRLSWPAVKVEVDVPVPEGLTCLCADRRFLYAVAAEGILVLDPIAGVPVRTIPRPEYGLQALGSVGDGFALATPTRAWLDDATFTERDDLPESGVHAAWFASDGKTLWAGTRAGLATVPLPDDEASSQRWEWPMPLRACVGTCIGHTLLLAGERSDNGHDGELVGGLFDPRIAEPVAERLSLGIYEGAQQGAVRYVLGPKPIDSIERLAKELARVAKVPDALVQRADGSKGLMAVVIEAHPGVPVASVKAVWDTVLAAGFDRVHAPDQEAYALEQRRKAAARK